MFKDILNKMQNQNTFPHTSILVVHVALRIFDVTLHRHCPCTHARCAILGYFLDESLGLLFPWGLWIDGHILPADVTHLYGLVFIFPYLYMLFGALVIYQKRSWRYKLISNVIFAIVFILQILHCIEFYLCYGVLATLIGTCGVGRLVFVIYVRKHARELL